MSQGCVWLGIARPRYEWISKSYRWILYHLFNFYWSLFGEHQRGVIISALGCEWSGCLHFGQVVSVERLFTDPQLYYFCASLCKFRFRRTRFILHANWWANSRDPTWVWTVILLHLCVRVERSPDILRKETRLIRSWCSIRIELFSSLELRESTSIWMVEVLKLYQEIILWSKNRIPTN